MKCLKVQELLSGHLDNELVSMDAQKVRVHLEDCSTCREEYEKQRKIKEELEMMSFESPTASEWEKAKPDMIIKGSRSIGWILFIVSYIGLIIFAVYQFMQDQKVLTLEKILTLGVILGLGMLLFSVIRERRIAMKTDKYTEVEK